MSDQVKRSDVLEVLTDDAAQALLKVNPEQMRFVTRTKKRIRALPAAEPDQVQAAALALAEAARKWRKLDGAANCESAYPNECNRYSDDASTYCAPCQAEAHLLAATKEYELLAHQEAQEGGADGPDRAEVLRRFAAFARVVVDRAGEGAVDTIPIDEWCGVQLTVGDYRQLLELAAQEGCTE